MSEAAAEQFVTVKYTVPEPRIARILLNRPERANAQNMQMLYELNAALDRACADDEIRVIVIAAEGKHFSSGHDLSGANDWSLSEVGISQWGGFRQPGMQGKVIAGGLMLVWPFDIVVASDDATFQDPVVAFGANGVEYFGHPWEFGVRKAKELLFTGRAITARVAYDLGMVNRVVPRDRLADETLELAREIAAQPMMGLKTAKESVNQMQNEQGLYAALRSAMGMQQLAHAHNYVVHKMAVDPAGGALVRELAKKPPLEQ
jgi:enoyl-CoA hydratase